MRIQILRTKDRYKRCCVLFKPNQLIIFNGDGMITCGQGIHLQILYDNMHRWEYNTIKDINHLNDGICLVTITEVLFSPIDFTFSNLIKYINLKILGGYGYFYFPYDEDVTIDGYKFIINKVRRRFPNVGDLVTYDFGFLGFITLIDKKTSKIEITRIDVQNFLSEGYLREHTFHSDEFIEMIENNFHSFEASERVYLFNVGMRIARDKLICKFTIDENKQKGNNNRFSFT